jgi:hypothetical protein
MSRLLDHRVTEWGVWYHNNKTRQGDLGLKVQFLQKALDGAIELLAIATKDIQRLEGRDPDKGLRPLLYVPTGRVNLEPIMRQANGG